MKFNKLVVIFSFALAAGIVAFFLGQTFVRRVSEPVPAVSSSETELSSPNDEELVSSPVSSYEYGYEKGMRAFLEQQGLPVPVLVRYTNLVEEELDPEEAGRGYIDGYHKAGGGVYCPR